LKKLLETVVAVLLMLGWNLVAVIATIWLVIHVPWFFLILVFVAAASFIYLTKI
jgi:hypothetical protein